MCAGIGSAAAALCAVDVRACPERGEDREGEAGSRGIVIVGGGERCAALE